MIRQRDPGLAGCPQGSTSVTGYAARVPVKKIKKTALRIEKCCIFAAAMKFESLQYENRRCGLPDAADRVIAITPPVCKIL